MKSLFIALIVTTLSIASEPFIDLSKHVKAVLPSVVQIKVQKSEPSNYETELTASDSGGSGFILSNGSSYIVTNAHVIGDGKKIAIIDYQNNEFSAVLVAKDEKTDIAVLQSKTFNAPALLESNSSISAGEGVFAVGSPFSLGHSVTYGIVGATERFLPNYPYIRFIQMDAAINPGNSGGALFNQQGELIGMVSTYFSKQGSYTNLAFALPIGDVHRVVSRLMEEKKISRGYLGADILVSERISRKLGQKASVLVTRVEPNSPAHQSGLQAGDLIIGFNEIILKDGGEFHRYLEQTHPNEIVSLALIRDRERDNLTIKLGSQPTEKKEIINAGTADSSEQLGLVLREDNNVLQVIYSYGMAKIVGLNAKDTIEQINGINIKTIQELNMQINKLKDSEIALIRIKRSGTEFTLPFGNKTALKAYTSRN